MNILRRHKWVALFVLSSASIYAVFVHYTQSQVPVTFTARYIESSTDVIRGRTAVKQPLYWAVRSDGATSGGWLDPKEGYRRITSPSARWEADLSDPLKLKTTLDYSYITLTVPRRSKPADCRPSGPVVTLSGLEMIGDYRAYRYRLIMPRSGGEKEEADQWFAPDLNCWDIQLRARKYDVSGNLTGLFEKKVTELTLGEPDEALFAVPADYIEVAPSERSKRALLRSIYERGGSDAVARYAIPSSLQSMWKHLDERYNSVTNKKWQPLSER
jgi:hypothetical protein